MTIARIKLSTRERTRLFLLHGGKCHLCEGKIDGSREAWDISHDIPLAAGGADDDANRKPAHRKCHRDHTARVDAPLIAKVKRQTAMHTGATVSPYAGRLHGAGFRKAPPQRSATRPLARRSEQP